MLLFTVTFIFVGKSIANANNNFIYNYKIIFHQDHSNNREKLKAYLQQFAHPKDIISMNEKTIELNTIYKINETIFIGKFEKINFPIQSISLQSQSPITDEAKNKIEEFNKQKELERIKAGK